MRIMNMRGDEEVEWDTEVQETVDAAAARFAEVLLAGHQGFVTSPGDTKQIKEFDPLAERIVVIPPMVGG
jgi:hypothetical protein